MSCCLLVTGGETCTLTPAFIFVNLLDLRPCFGSPNAKGGVDFDLFEMFFLHRALNRRGLLGVATVFRAFNILFCPFYVSFVFLTIELLALSKEIDFELCLMV